MTPALTALAFAILGVILALVALERTIRLRALIHSHARDVAALHEEIDGLSRAVGLGAVPGPASEPDPRIVVRIQQALGGVAPPGAWQLRVPPVDETIPTSAKVPALEPGDRDEFEVPEPEDTRPLATEPPG